MKSIEEALELMLAHVPPASQTLRCSPVGLQGAVLAENVFTPEDLPGFDNSAVDGYAVSALETQGASQSAPLRLSVLQDIPAGAFPLQPLKPGSAARIMTGAAVPAGADAIVMREDTRERENVVEILVSARKGQHIRRRGEELRAGEIAVSAGTLLEAAGAGLIGSCGKENVLVYAGPKVAVITTGDEVVPISTFPLPPGCLRNSNAHSIQTAVLEAGGELHSVLHLPDNLEAIETAFRGLMEASERPDLILTVGGVSVGDRDFVKPVLEKLGTLELWRVAMKPGKPLAFGSLGKSLFVGLPGNPVSALVCFELFVRPMIRKAKGYSSDRLSRPILKATLRASVRHTPGRREFLRGTAYFRDGDIFAMPLGAQGSEMLTGLARANALLIVPEQAETLAAGETIRVMLIPD